ncbi:hypothetical protein PROFUN_12932, partial [Planoprotostelium fungivorum]
ACLFVALALGATASQFSDAWVDAHNAYRAKYGLNPLSWDDKAAALAQSWADKCQFQHGGASGYGQNIWMSSGGGTCNLNDVKGSVNSWTVGEEKSWTCGQDMWGAGCKGGWANCGHLTQVVWETTTKVGCACGSTCKLVVCNYNPPGNFQGRQPFPASKCSGNHSTTTTGSTTSGSSTSTSTSGTSGNHNVTRSHRPTTGGTGTPTTHERPTEFPTNQTRPTFHRPTERPTGFPTNQTRPTFHRPTERPTHHRPTGRPTHERPTDMPTERPTFRPPWTGGGSGRPTERPTVRPPWSGRGSGRGN